MISFTKETSESKKDGNYELGMVFLGLHYGDLSDYVIIMES